MLRHAVALVLLIYEEMSLMDLRAYCNGKQSIQTYVDNQVTQ